MKLIILILIIISGSVSDGYRLPTLTIRLKIEDPLHLSKLCKAAKSLFNAIALFFQGIDTKEESNLKQFLNTTKATKLKKESLPRPNPNAFFPYVYYTANSKIITNSTVKESPRPRLT